VQTLWNDPRGPSTHLRVRSGNASSWPRQNPKSGLNFWAQSPGDVVPFATSALWTSGRSQELGICSTRPKLN